MAEVVERASRRGRLRALTKRASLDPYQESPGSESTGITTYLEKTTLDWGTEDARATDAAAKPAESHSVPRRSSVRSSTRNPRPQQPTGEVRQLKVSQEQGVALGIHVASSVVASTVTHVFPGTAGARAGLLVGDVVLAVNGKELHGTTLGKLLSTKQYQKAASLQFTVRRDVMQAELAPPSGGSRQTEVI